MPLTDTAEEKKSQYLGSRSAESRERGMSTSHGKLESITCSREDVGWASYTDYRIKLRLGGKNWKQWSTALGRWEGGRERVKERSSRFGQECLHAATDWTWLCLLRPSTQQRLGDEWSPSSNRCRAGRGVPRWSGRQTRGQGCQGVSTWAAQQPMDWAIGPLNRVAACSSCDKNSGRFQAP